MDNKKVLEVKELLKNDLVDLQDLQQLNDLKVKNNVCNSLSRTNSGKNIRKIKKKN